MKKMTAVDGRLHNFEFPGNLKWGKRRQFRCVKFEVDDDDDEERIPADHRRRREVDYSREEVDLKKRERKERLIYDPSFVESDFRRGRRQFGGYDVKPSRKFKPSKGNGGDYGYDADEGNGIAAVREKLISDIRIAADKLIWKETPAAVEEVEVEEEVGWQYFRNKSSSPEKPDGLEGAAVEAKHVAAIQTVNVSEFDDENNDIKKNRQIRLRNGGSGGGGNTEKEEMVKFSATISKSEVEEDLIALTGGRRPPRKPKKRPRSVQNSVDFLSPGSSLTEVKARRRYEVCHNRRKI